MGQAEGEKLMQSIRVSGKVSALFLAAVTLPVCGQQAAQQVARPHPGHSAASQGRTPQQQSRGMKPAPQMAQPTDPNKFSQNLQHASFEEGMRKMVNPCNRDYGKIFDGWQDVTVQYTIQNIVWWGCVLAVLGLLSGLG
jgi:hypothetical protein